MPGDESGMRPMPSERPSRPLDINPIVDYIPLTCPPRGALARHRKGRAGVAPAGLDMQPGTREASGPRPPPLRADARSSLTEKRKCFTKSAAPETEIATVERRK